MTQAAKKLLRRIGDTEEASLNLTRSIANAADELKGLGFATFIPLARGGADVALTRPGIDEYEKLYGKEE